MEKLEGWVRWGNVSVLWVPEDVRRRYKYTGPWKPMDGRFSLPGVCMR